MGNGAEVALVISGPPFPPFPRHRSLVHRRWEVTGPGGVPTIVLPFLNLSTAKWLTMGCVTFLEICRWARGLSPGKTGVVLLYNLSLPPALFSLAAARLSRAKTLAFVADIYAPGEIAPATLKRRIDFRCRRRSWVAWTVSY